MPQRPCCLGQTLICFEMCWPVSGYQLPRVQHDQSKPSVSLAFLTSAATTVCQSKDSIWRLWAGQVTVRLQKNRHSWVNLPALFLSCPSYVQTCINYILPRCAHFTALSTLLIYMHKHSLHAAGFVTNCNAFCFVYNIWLEGLKKWKMMGSVSSLVHPHSTHSFYSAAL